ncbi:ferredoxin [Aromatoleum toluvorans]|uniref:Ferredoxin n=1 Tax=Aromatoleum toluvorans TaxID=92002 RepID=A0ABX1PZ10_9RHOO|nr:4Fe-4S dicluster domain-containing protein [Aromatoleum toluvorans]NMG44440.1 ferredoxin [Aromatoleum toluvorans]
MAYKIVSSQCSGCSACEPECPNDAIHEKNGVFAIKADKCTECIGFFDDPQCVVACPVDKTVIVDKSVPRYQA